MLHRELEIGRELYDLRHILQQAAGVSVVKPHRLAEVTVPVPYTFGLFTQKRTGLIMERAHGIVGRKQCYRIDPGLYCRLDNRMAEAVKHCEEHGLHLFAEADPIKGDCRHHNTLYNREKDILYMLDFGCWYRSAEEKLIK